MSTMRSIYKLSKRRPEGFDKWARKFRQHHDNFPCYDCQLDKIQATMIALDLNLFDLRLVAENLIYCEKMIESEAIEGEYIPKHHFEMAVEQTIELAKTKVDKFRKRHGNSKKY